MHDIGAAGGLAKGKVSRALWFGSAGQATLRETELPSPQEGEALVKMLFSGISRGTERLVFCGRVPPREFARMRAPFQEGEFSFPVKYGYCAVGLVEEGPAEWIGATVFALHPHQDRFIVPVSALARIPQNIPARRATLAANMETALNAVWDSGAGPGDRIAIVGGGVIGMLVAALCARLPGAQVTLADIAPERRPSAGSLGAGFVDARASGDAMQDCDIVFHASASAQGLALALASAGREARVVELSWYGDHDIPVSLGGAFHSRRLHLMASQVGEIAASRRPRWSHARRMAKALDLLDDARLDALVAGEVAFADAAGRMPELLAPDAPGLFTVLVYP